jgi:peptidoglycan hydrolase-like protein with peptidoglycan-binding domain
MRDGLVQVVTPSDTDTELIPRIPAPGRRRIGYGVIAVAALAGVVAVAGIGWGGRHTAQKQPADEQPAVQSAALVKMDMSNTQSLAGTLGYGTARSLKGNRNGIVTWLPTPGRSVKRGQQLYRVDDQPVLLFYGGMPLFRVLSDRNTVGRDVRIVADNLRALGYSIGSQPAPGQRVPQTQPASTPAPTPSGAPGATASATQWVTVHRGDGVLTAPLQAAVKRWQTDAQLRVTGTLGPGDVAVLTGAIRVDSVAAQPGDSADATLMSVTPTAKVVTVQADATQAGAIEQGDRVTVELPDDKTAAGRVAAVGTALKTADGSSGGSTETPKLTVTITVDKPAAIAKLDSADVQVDFVAETHKGVLAAPVGALLALSEGGYAVQVEGGGLVAVQTGIFAKGLVEVDGDGLAEGTKVVTTS